MGGARTRDRLGFTFQFASAEDALAVIESTPSPRKRAHALVAADLIIHTSGESTAGPHECQCRSSTGAKKVLLASSDEAIAVAASMAADLGKAFTPYRCRGKTGWHVGTAPAPAAKR